MSGHGQACKGQCQHVAPVPLQQSLEEMDFERGPWTAAMRGDVARLQGMIDRDKRHASARDKSGYTPLHYAARAGHMEAIRLLLRCEADPNAATTLGRSTPLHRAAYCGHVEAVKLLLAARAGAGAADSDGQTALHKALRQEQHAVVQLLEGQGG
mmetsp:Transcript_101305/g.174942  ORF Transcript_101305/g.174942 Transcript_101305/m.174942 type:complete len:155 (-) Transcript_101305:516-980(-)